MVTQVLRFRSYIVLTILLSLMGCASNDDSTPIQTTISGTVTAPATSVVQFEQQSITDILASLFISNLQAAMTGLTPVTNAMVELIHINEDGSQKGAVVASTMSNSVTGEYSLVFSGSIASDMVVQVTSDGGTPMRALVVSESTDINPVTEYVIQKILESIQSNASLEVYSIPATAVTDLIDMVEALDVNFTGAMTVNETITAIDAVIIVNNIDINTQASNSLYSLGLVGKVAVSTLTSSDCTDGTLGGWAYGFSEAGFTLVGSDTFISGTAGNCTLGVEETIILTHAEIQAIDDIPFNCGDDSVCTYKDLNKEMAGIDESSRPYVSTYTHTPYSSNVTHIKQVTNIDGSTTTYTENILLLSLVGDGNSDGPPSGTQPGGIPCSTVGSPYSYSEFEVIAYSCSASVQFNELIVAGSIVKIDGKTYTFDGYGRGTLEETVGMPPLEFQWDIHPTHDSLEIYIFPAGAQAPNIKRSLVITGVDSVTGNLKVKIYTEDINSSPIAGDLLFDGTKDGAVSDGIANIIYTPPLPPPPVVINGNAGVFAGAWSAPCVSSDATTYLISSLMLDSNGAFSLSVSTYSDSACTSAITSNTLAGTLNVGKDILLDDGSTGQAVDFFVPSTDGTANNINLFAIFQMDTVNANMFKMGQLASDAAQRDVNNTLSNGVEFFRQ